MSRAASRMLGVTTRAWGRRSSQVGLDAVVVEQRRPVEATRTGSTTRLGSRPAAAHRATAATVADEANMPVFTAATGRSRSTVSICRSTKAGSTCVDAADLGRVLRGDGGHDARAEDAVGGEGLQVGLQTRRRRRSRSRRSSWPPGGPRRHGRSEVGRPLHGARRLGQVAPGDAAGQARLVARLRRRRGRRPPCAPAGGPG